MAAVVASEEQSFWREFLRSLLSRGLKGVRLVTAGWSPARRPRGAAEGLIPRADVTGTMRVYPRRPTIGVPERSRKSWMPSEAGWDERVAREYRPWMRHAALDALALWFVAATKLYWAAEHPWDTAHCGGPARDRMDSRLTGSTFQTEANASAPRPRVPSPPKRPLAMARCSILRSPVYSPHASGGEPLILPAIPSRGAEGSPCPDHHRALLLCSCCRRSCSSPPALCPGRASPPS